MPSTSEDVDLERKYEHLPLSELITADKNIGMKSFTDDEFVQKTWAVVLRASEEVQVSFAQGLMSKVLVI